MKSNEERSFVSISRKAIEKNYNTFRKKISKEVFFMAVVKSNAYGHCMVSYAKELERLGADWFGVDDVDEALELRRNGIKKPILVLGYTLPLRFKEASKHNISVTISNFDSLNSLLKSDLNGKLKIHIKVDTGLNRQGFRMQDLDQILHEFSIFNFQFSKMRIEGLYSHLAAAENPEDKNYTSFQIDNFKKWQSAFESAGFNPICHIGATAATLVAPGTHLDMVRVGIGLYGLWPSEEIREIAGKKAKLHPSLSWKSVVGDVKTVPAGSLVGYDCTEELRRDKVLAVVPVGYWHGLPRAMSSVGEVLIRGKRAKIVGRVSMDMISVDVTSIKGIRTGDEVVIIGKQKTEEISSDDLARRAGTINYEIVTRINPLIKRFFF